MKILITGSTGHLGGATIDFLIKKIPANSIAALARNSEKAKTLAEKGVDVRIGNYDDYQSLVKAFQGIDKLLLISASELINRSAQHINAINAAKEAGVKHIVYTSFIRQKDDPNSALWFIAKDHVETEKHLVQTGIPYTLFKNGFYMDMVTDFIGTNVLETQTIFLPAGKGKVNFALRNEIAEALANVLTTEEHGNKSYNIGGETTVSFREIADCLTEISGKKISYISPDVETYKQELSKHNMPEQAVNMVAAFAVAFSENAMDVPSKDLNNLLGRNATDVKTFLSETFKNSYNPLNLKMMSTKEISKQENSRMGNCRLLTALYLYSASGKLFLHPEQMEQMHLADWRIIIALGEIVSALLFLFPKTNKVGTLLLSSYMGGAIIIHMTGGIGIVMPVVVLMFVWVGFYLRNPKFFKLK